MLVVGLVLVLVGGGFWVFFANGVDTIQPTVLSADILQIADSRLSKGDEAAPVKIVEYADVLCPFCAKVQSEVFPKIQTEYIATKKVHYEVRLVAATAPDSRRAGEGAYCAAEQDKFWTYLDVAYKRTWDDYYSKDKSVEEVPYFSKANISDFARSVSLDMFDWNRCMETGKYKAVLAENRQKMREIDAFGTPHFIINDTNYSGSPPYVVFKGTIDAELGKAGAK